MKKPARKLDLRTETVRSLTGEALRAVGGGFIMKDSVIVRTSGIVAPATDVDRP